MRQLSVNMLTIVIVFSTILTAIAEEEIRWAANLEQARMAAAQQNKLLLIHFWAPDCAPCKVVDRKVFPLPTVARAINENFVALKVNAQADEALRDHFGVTRWPMDVVATVDGVALHQMVTDQNPNQYIHKLVSIVDQQTPRTFANLARNQQGQSASQLPSQNSWAAGVHPPDITQSTAIAERPGLDPSTRPGVNVVAPSHQMPSSDSELMPRPSRFDSSQTDARFSQFRGNYADTPAIANFSPQRGGPSAPARGSTSEAAPASRPAVIDNTYTGRQPSSLPTQNARPEKQQINNSYVTQPSASPSTGAIDGRRDFDVARSSQPEVGPVPNNTPNASPANLGLDGRCPVTLITMGRWRKGDPKWGAIHRGKTYLFAGLEQQRQFLANPDDYSPALAGMDLVRLAEHGLVAEGTREFGVLYDDDGAGKNRSRIYLFDSKETRNRFESAPEQFLVPVMQAMQRGTLDLLIR